MKNKFLLCFALILLVPLAFGFIQWPEKTAYHKAPEWVINMTIMSTLDRIESELYVATTGERDPDPYLLFELLTLYGSLNQQFTGMMGPERYPLMENGNVVAAFLSEDAQHRRLDPKKVGVLKQLYPLYDEMSLVQATLVTEKGQLQRTNSQRLGELDNQLRTLLKKHTASIDLTKI